MILHRLKVCKQTAKTAVFLHLGTGSCSRRRAVASRRCQRVYTARMNALRRWMVGLNGLLLLALSFFVTLCGWWVMSGLGAFASEWGGRFEAGVLNETEFRRLYPNIDVPNANVFRRDLDAFIGQNLAWTVLVTQTATLVSGVVLLAIAVIPSRSKVSKAQ